MTEKTFPIELGGRRWELPRLPWKIVREVQPGLLRQSRRLLQGDDATIAHRIDEKALAEQTRLLALALRFVDSSVTTETLDELAIDYLQIAKACLSALRACGLAIGVEDAAPAPVGAAAAAE